MIKSQRKRVAVEIMILTTIMFCSIVLITRFDVTDGRYASSAFAAVMPGTLLYFYSYFRFGDGSESIPDAVTAKKSPFAEIMQCVCILNLTAAFHAACAVMVIAFADEDMLESLRQIEWFLAAAQISVVFFSCGVAAIRLHGITIILGVFYCSLELTIISFSLNIFTKSYEPSLAQFVVPILILFVVGISICWFPYKVGRWVFTKVGEDTG